VRWYDLGMLLSQSFDNSMPSLTFFYLYDTAIKHVKERKAKS